MERTIEDSERGVGDLEPLGLAPGGTSARCRETETDFEELEITESDYRIRVASDRFTREEAYQLAFRLYRRAGLAPDLSGSVNEWPRIETQTSEGRGLLAYPYDARPDTLTLLAKDLRGVAAGTMTLVLDSPAGLPCDEIYGAEVNALRKGGSRIAEGVRLGFEDEALFSEGVFPRSLNLLFIYGVRVLRCTDVVIEVHPRQVNYYRRMLGFISLGPQRPCPRVKGAPAVLLRLRTRVYERELRRWTGRAGPGGSAEAENMYARFFPRSRERRIARMLAQSRRPMDAEEIRYFGLG